MDSWKYYDIVHKRHTLMNPVNEERLFELFDLLNLPQGARVTDIGCGKGEVLVRLVEKCKIKGVGIDLSPYSVRDAESRRRERVPNAGVKILEMNGADYKPEREESEDLTICMGASWIYKGYKNTLRALARMTKPHGYVMVGEPFWRKNPPQTYLKRAGFSKRLFGTHQENVMAGPRVSLAPVYSLVSSETDWDNYEGLHWFAAREYAVSHPDDPDLKDLLSRDAKDRETYLRYERDILGWAIYLFQKKS